MPNRRFRAYNGTTSALTAAPVFVTTGTALKTMMQLKPSANMTVHGWGFVLDGNPTVPTKVELIDTGTVNATVTAYPSASDIVKIGSSGGTAADLTLATSGSGYTSSAEGTITATRLLDVGPPMANAYYQRFELDRENDVISGNILRIRVTTTVAINMLCWIDFEQK